MSWVKFLGCGFYRDKGTTRIRIHPKSVTKMRNKAKEVTARSKGISNEDRIMKLKRYIQGWINYFKLADMKKNAIANGRMDAKACPHDLLETMETGKNQIQDVKTLGVQERKHGNTQTQGRATGELPVALSSLHLLRTIPSGILDLSSFPIITDKSLCKLRNLRIPIGTYGGVGGRLLN